LERAHGLDAVVRAGRHLPLAERVAFSAVGHVQSTTYQQASHVQIILLTMLPSFFDSVLELIVRTSTDLPPDVRAAMRQAREAEPADTRSGPALAIIAQDIDLAAGG